MGKAFLNREMRTGQISGILPHWIEAAGFVPLLSSWTNAPGKAIPGPLEAAKKNETNQAVSKNRT